MSFKVGDKVQYDREECEVILVDNHRKEVVLCGSNGYVVVSFFEIKPTPTLEERLEEIVFIKKFNYRKKEALIVNLKDVYFGFKVNNMTDDEIFDKCNNIIKAFKK